MSSPISVLLDTMGIEDLCAKYYISLRQSLFMGSLYLILIGNLLLLILTTALQKVRKCGNFRIFLSFTFYVKLILENVDSRSFKTAVFSILKELSLLFFLVK